MEQHPPVQLTSDNTGAPQCGDGDRVDEEILSELFMVFEDGFADGLVDVCDTFRRSVPARLAEIDAALVEGRFGEASRAAHNLRGSTGTFGARRLSALATCLEDECGKGDRIAGLSLLDEMRAEFAIFRDILDARMAQLPK
jgi:HPt (histidine-containing phosphotransfer) domain-containing protein